jgi:ABC-type branched-subunit amino acid transport system substrate-binding protein
MIGTVSGAMFLRQPEDPLILNVRKGYHAEIEALLEHLIDEKGHTRIGVFYQNDSFGHTGLHSLKALLDERGMALVGEGSYKRNTLSVGHAIYELESTGPDAIIMIGAARPVVEFIRRSITTPLSRATKAVVSFASAQTIMVDLQCVASNLIFSHVVPLPWGESPDVALYREQMAKYYPDVPVGFSSLEGYFAAKVAASVFEKLGPNFTKREMVRALHHLPKSAFKDRSIVVKDNSCGCLDTIYITQYRNNTFELLGEYTDE